MSFVNNLFFIILKGTSTSARSMGTVSTFNIDQSTTSAIISSIPSTPVLTSVCYSIMYYFFIPTLNTEAAGSGSIVPFAAGGAVGGIVVLIIIVIVILALVVGRRYVYSIMINCNTCL